MSDTGEKSKRLYCRRVQTAYLAIETEESGKLKRGKKDNKIKTIRNISASIKKNTANINRIGIGNTVIAIVAKQSCLYIMQKQADVVHE